MIEIEMSTVERMMVEGLKRYSARKTLEVEVSLKC